jgi:hypothetical protein
MTGSVVRTQEQFEKIIGEEQVVMEREKAEKTNNEFRTNGGERVAGRSS